MTELTVDEVVALDRAHVIHPLHNAAQTATGPLVLVSGEGCMVRDSRGNEYLDGLSQLWNVNVGHGRGELAEAAADQMSRLAFASNYNGQANLPAVQLAEKLTEISYPGVRSVYFTSGGAESNESAFKLARSFWKLQGQPEKVKIISRKWAYHGVTIAAMSATGLPAYHTQFEPLAPGFLQIEAPYWYRWEGRGTPAECGAWAADQLEQAILREGPGTVAAFIAEPVQGAGGVIPPPDGYFQRVREICDRHDVLFIADEVITGFGRTGRMFALGHWGVEPDIVSFAKGVTSGYVPLGGILLGERVDEALRSLPPEQAWMHAYTYSGHPTSCAVGIANIRIIEREGLVENASRMGERLQRGLGTLASLPAVGDVRGLGLLGAVELVADKETRAAFPAADGVGAKVLAAARERGILFRNRGDVVEMAPPLVVSEEQIDRMVSVLGESIQAVL
ncbi:MAG: aspartate aminotransferase family protein [Candidatus Dormibacteraeota bacterium]|nr:aspartate aminotransferase family protein [Candidatus Dormibacteraeota bacterium]MBO0761898.1 aspartate aminotransferase family protein [Candidatus Dormibacteraeota bacterium]